jgi:hypothetical protein
MFADKIDCAGLTYGLLASNFFSCAAVDIDIAIERKFVFYLRYAWHFTVCDISVDFRFIVNGTDFMIGLMCIFELYLLDVHCSIRVNAQQSLEFKRPTFTVIFFCCRR